MNTAAVALRGYVIKWANGREDFAEETYESAKATVLAEFPDAYFNEDDSVDDGGAHICSIEVAP